MKNLEKSLGNQGLVTRTARSSSSEPPKKRSVTLVYVPMYFGGPHRGTLMGPDAMRVAEFSEKLQSMGVNVHREVQIPIVPSSCWLDRAGNKMKCVPEIVEASLMVAEATELAMADGTIPITIGGDHSVAIGSIAGVAAHYRKMKQKLGLVWFDAHGDINTPDTTSSGNVHGMPFAVAIGEGDERFTNINGYMPKVEAKNAALIGIRDLDHGERGMIHSTGVTAYTMRDVDRMGMAHVTEMALSAIGEVDGIHLSFDIDVMDPEVAPGVSTPSRGGLNARECMLALTQLAETNQVRSIDIVELNPARDLRNKTAKLAVDLAMTALGNRIL